MTVRDVGKKMNDIDAAINEIYAYFPKNKKNGYYEYQEPMAVLLLKEYAEMLEGLEVKVGGNV